MPGRHPAEHLLPVIHRQRTWGGGDHYDFEVFDIAGAQPLTQKDGFVVPDTFRSNGWKLSLDPAYTLRQVRTLRDGSAVMREVPRRGWRDFRFSPIYVVSSEWRSKSSAESFQEVALDDWNRTLFKGQVQTRMAI